MHQHIKRVHKNSEQTFSHTFSVNHLGSKASYGYWLSFFLSKVCKLISYEKFA